MNHLKSKYAFGFTLIELLVVISVIGLLSTLALVNLNKSRAKARDVRRMSDLDQVKKALLIYNDKKNNWIEAGSGCGWSGNGAGWFNYTGPSYPKSIVQCLIDEKIIGVEIIDPTKGRTSTAASGYAYMKYTCSGKTYVYAKLEGVPQNATATDGTCCPTCDSNYGMNYFISI